MILTILYSLVKLLSLSLDPSISKVNNATSIIITIVILSNMPLIILIALYNKPTPCYY